jgi:hypothetical protein
MTGGVVIGIGTGIGVLWLGLRVRTEFECLAGPVQGAGVGPQQAALTKQSFMARRRCVTYVKPWLPVRGPVSVRWQVLTPVRARKPVPAWPCEDVRPGEDRGEAAGGRREGPGKAAGGEMKRVTGAIVLGLSACGYPLTQLVFCFFLPETNALRPGRPARGGGPVPGAVDPQFDALGVGEQVFQRAQPHSGTFRDGEAAGRQQRADLADRPGDGGAVPVRPLPGYGHRAPYSGGCRRTVFCHGNGARSGSTQPVLACGEASVAGR